MRKISILSALVAALFSTQALADWTGKDASNATITFKNPVACASVVCVPVAQLYDGTNVVTLTTAGADAVSNTLTGVPMYGRNLVYNGTTWDMWRGDTTNGAWVNVKNTLTAVTPGDGITTTIYGTAPASPVIGVPLLWNGTTYDRQKSAGATGIAAVRQTDGTTNATMKAASTPAVASDTAMVVDQRPGTIVASSLTAATTGGSTPYTPFVPAASDNHQTVKNGAGTSYSVTTSNNSATKNYLRLYDAGTGFNGCNSATGVIFAMEIPPSDSGFTVLTGGVNGLAFSTGLSVCVTSGFGLTDTTNATATAMYVNIAYK